MANQSNPLKVDAVVVGMGILGLLLAKRLLDLGQTVVVLEKSPTIAHGASIKNHGWLHSGTSHTLSAKDIVQGTDIAKQLQYGHAFFKSYAPECFDEPFKPSYAITKDNGRAMMAREIWSQCGVPYTEIPVEDFLRIEPNIDASQVAAAFQIADGRINNRLMFMKLYAEIKRKGAAILTGASYEYESNNTVHIKSMYGELSVHSPLFFYTTGANLNNSYQKLTGKSLTMEHYKSHLLYLPRITDNSIIGLDDDSPIIVNHDGVSVVNRPHDQVLSMNGDYRVDEAEVNRTLALLVRAYPGAATLSRDDIKAAACLKPSVSESGFSVDFSVHQPLPGHIFALPGKMTAAPYVADKLISQISSQLNLNPITPRPFDTDTDFTSVAPKQSQQLARV